MLVVMLDDIDRSKGMNNRITASALQPSRNFFGKNFLSGTGSILETRRIQNVIFFMWKAALFWVSDSMQESGMFFQGTKIEIQRPVSHLFIRKPLASLAVQ